MIKLHNLIEDINTSRMRNMSNIDRGVINWINPLIHESVCFDAGNVTDLPRLKIIPELFKLPYPVTWIESTVADGVVGLLATQTGEYEYDVAIFENQGKAWGIIGVVRVTTTHEPPMVSLVANIRGVDIDGIHEYMRDVVSTILATFLMALNCTNTETKRFPAPKALNKKRTKRGRQPIFSYWTLFLPNSSAGGGNGKGDHASPRLHLRRGHPRQYKLGLYTWVSACVVGDKRKGIAHKDYAYRNIET